VVVQLAALAAMNPRADAKGVVLLDDHNSRDAVVAVLGSAGREIFVYKAARSWRLSRTIRRPCPIYLSV